MAVISAFCQCSAVAIVRSLTPVEISLALTNGGEIVPRKSKPPLSCVLIRLGKRSSNDAAPRSCASRGDGLDVPAQSADALATDQFAV
jgi:hypothetical protein